MKKPDFLRKPMTIEVKEIAGITPEELLRRVKIPLIPKKDPIEKIVVKSFGKHPNYVKPPVFKVFLNNISNIIRLKYKNLVTNVTFYFKKIAKLKGVLTIPSFIILHGTMGLFILITFFGFMISWESLIHIVACGSVWYLIYDFVKMMKEKTVE